MKAAAKAIAVELCRLAKSWTRRLDDAKRFPEVLLEQAPGIVLRFLQNPDDATPVDVDWLNGIRNADGSGLSMIRVRMMEDRTFRLMSPCQNPREGIEGIGDWVANRTATRGDVRRLCEALAIDLQEQETVT